AIGAAGYLGVGSVWALGLSSSAALLMAAPASLPQSIQQISGVIPLSQTLGLWQGMLIPSAGGKWLIEAPYILDAAKSLQMHLGWVVQIYNATEALANLIHPFWMLPLLGILGLKARDIVGYSMLQFVIHVPLVLFLVWIL